MSTEFSATAKKGLQILRGHEKGAKIAYTAGIIGGGLLLSYYLLPYIIIALENLLLFALLVVVTLVVGYILLSPTFQNAAVYFLDNLILRFHNLVISSDPFSTAQNSIKKLKKRLEQMATSVKSLGGTKKKLEDKVADFTNQREQALNRALLAEKQGNDIQKARFANKAKQLKTALDTINPMLTKATGLHAFLMRMHGVLEGEVGKAEDSLSVALQTYDIMQDSADAVAAAQKAMSGPDQEMFKQSMEEISSRTFAMVGEIEFFMDVTQPLLDMKDFESQANTMDALKELQEWANRDSEFMPTQEKRQLLLEAGDPSLLVPVSGAKMREKVPVKKGEGDKYNLLK